MNEFSNPAKRVFNLLSEAKKYTDEPVAVVWSNIFGLDAEEGRKDPHQVTQKLILLRNELDRAEKMMKRKGFSEDLYVPYMEKVRAAIASSTTGYNWKSYSPNLGGETMLCLRFCSELLDEEPEGNFEELQAILDELEKFKASVKKTDSESSLYAFVMAQIEIMEGAILDYPISGGEAIKKAFHEGWMDVMDRESELSEQKHTEETRNLGAIWERLKKATQPIVDADRMANSLIGIFQKGESIADKVSELLPYTPN